MVLNHLDKTVIFLLDSKSPGGATLTRGSINLLQNFRHYSYQPENVELESLIDLTLLTIMPLFSAEVKNLKFFIASFVKPFCIILFCNFKAN